jgi:hypothetical protein
MTQRATGSFDVKIIPHGSADTTDSVALARMSIDKQFHGDLQATSKGEMVTAGIEANGSAAYVAMERVTGTLHGRSGTFVLMHSATMTRDFRYLTVTIVPALATGELVGISGTLTINIVDRQHLYELEYQLPA